MSANLASYEYDNAYPFLSEVAQMRRRARAHMQAESLGGEFNLIPPTVVRLLNDALATELVCVVRYRRHSALAGAAMADTVRQEFLKYAQEEQGHADQLAARILELGGQPLLQAAAQAALPAAAESEEIDTDGLADLLEEDLIAERIAIESYREMIQFLGANDPATGQLLQSILAVELAHAEELAAMRADVLRRERFIGGATSARLPLLELH